jgi:cell division septal protein FtsQ
MRKSQWRRPHRYKIKKSVLKNRFFWLSTLVVLILFSIFYFLFFSDVFQVEKIIITGQKKVSAEEIESLIPQKNIFLTDTEKIKEDILSRFPQIAALKIVRSFFDALSVTVTEREAVAYFCQGEACFLLDKEGVIFETFFPTPDLMKIESSSPVDDLVLGKPVIQKERLGQILEIKSKLAETPKISAVLAFLVSDERLNVKTSEGWEIYFNLKGDLDWQITELSVILEKETPPECAQARKEGKLEYVDLRFSRVYCK